MLSKISGFISPLLSKGDAVEKPDEKNREKGGGTKKQDTSPEESSDDDTFFSTEAVRALLLQENAMTDEATADLDLLQRYGVNSISIRNNQPVLEAIAEAAAPLKKE